ncbi:hypothetical protein B0H19DRAFT_1183903, partial [Mycena capillaripes]
SNNVLAFWSFLSTLITPTSTDPWIAEMSVHAASIPPISLPLICTRHACASLRQRREHICVQTGTKPPDRSRAVPVHSVGPSSTTSSKGSQREAEPRVGRGWPPQNVVIVP